MTRRRLLVALGTALTVLVAAGVWWLAPRGPGITLENCARIKKGMWLEEVEAVLGGPPRWVYRKGKRIGDSSGDGSSDVAMIAAWQDWNGMVTVYFSPDGTAVGGHLTTYAGHPSWLERLREAARRLFP